MYTPTQIEALSLVSQNYIRLHHITMLRTRYEIIDRYIQRTIDQAAVAQEAVTLADRTKIRNFEVPIVLEQLSAAHANLVGIFLTGMPIIGFVADYADEERRKVAQMMDSLAEQDQSLFNWTKALSACLYDALRYNIWAIETDWDSQDVVSMVANANGERTFTVSNAVQGNRLTHISPYQLLFDPSVPLDEVATSGAYVGHVKRVSYIAAKQYLQKLGRDSNNAILQNFKQALSRPNVQLVPAFNYPMVYLPTSAVTGQDWGNFFGLYASTPGGEHTGAFEILTLYVRLIPKEYGFSGKTSGTPTRYKMVWCSGTLVYCKPLNDAHNMFPLLVGHGTYDYLGFQTKSFVENLRDAQDIGSSLMNGALNSMRRAVSDRAVYNPLFIKPEDVNSQNPAAKLPLQPAAYNADAKNAYMPIPYEDRVGPYMQQSLGTVFNMAERITGLNPASRGSFVKGNRTRQEFDEVMSNSDARLRTVAIGLEGISTLR